MKKNFVIIALVAISCLGITGCGKKEQTTSNKKNSSNSNCAYFEQE